MSLRVRQVVVLLAALGMSMATAACGSDEASLSSRTVDLATAGPDTGDLLLSGRVHAGGSSVKGVQADLVLWPADLDEAKEGDIVETFRTSRVRADADGHFALRLDPDRIPSRYLPASSDAVNVDVEVWRGRKITMWSGTVSLLPGARVWRTDGSRAGDPVAAATFDLVSHRVTFTSSSGEVEKGTLPVGELPKGANGPS